MIKHQRTSEGIIKDPSAVIDDGPTTEHYWEACRRHS